MSQPWAIPRLGRRRRSDLTGRDPFILDAPLSLDQATGGIEGAGPHVVEQPAQLVEALGSGPVQPAGAVAPLGQPAGVLQDGEVLADRRPGDVEGCGDLAAGDFAGADEDLTRALELQPDAALTWMDRAGVRRAAGDPAAALADVGKAVELDPSYAFGWARRAELAGELGAHELVVEAASRVIELDPGYAWAFISRACARYALGDLDAAIGDFSRAIELDPGSASAYAGRARARLHSPTFERLFGNDVSEEPPETLMVALATHGPELQGAIADLRQAFQLDPEVAASTVGGDSAPADHAQLLDRILAAAAGTEIESDLLSQMQEKRRAYP